MEIFTKFKGTIKIKPIKIDNEVFQLHYRATALMIGISGALVASKQHFGDPIECITRDDVPAKIMNNYCWVHSTFTVPSACNNTSTALTPHPCIDTALDTLDNYRFNDFKPNGDQVDKIYHAYYQWVYFVLFFQAALFYAPHFFWKSSEAQLMSSLTEEMKDPIKSIQKKDKLTSTIKYLSDPDRWGMHDDYMRSFFKFELCNLVNIFLQIFMVNKFLHGSFSNYGWELLTRALNDIEETDADPTDRVFPKMTKCTFRRFGPSGDLNRYDAMCILPLNILNEKIYLIMWFWFLFLAIVTTCWIIYRFIIISKPRFRYWNLIRRANYTNTRHLKYVIENTPPGTWFLLSMMCHNMSPNAYSILVSRLQRSLVTTIAKRQAQENMLLEEEQRRQQQNRLNKKNQNQARQTLPRNSQTAQLALSEIDTGSHQDIDAEAADELLLGDKDEQ